MTLQHEELSRPIIGAAYEVYNILGYGFLEKVYQKAMQAELVQLGLHTEREYPIKVYYKGLIIGDYFADLFVEHKIIVELKIAKQYNPKDAPQLLNELKATGITTGLLINFGARKVEFKRFIYSQ